MILLLLSVVGFWLERVSCFVGLVDIERTADALTSL